MDDLISEFITETSESLSILDSELVKLEQNPDDPGLLSNIFRLMHTIKGTCGFLGLPRLEHVAHAAENVLGLIRDGKTTVTPEAVTLILESLDCIKGLLQHLEASGKEPEGSDENLIGRLNAFVDAIKDGKDPAAAPPAAAETAEAPAAPAEEEKTAAPLPPAQAQTPAPVPAPAAAAPAPAPKPAPTEAKQKGAEEGLNAADKDKNLAVQSIRVNLNVLESLMQMVGELVLTRNQLMQLVRTRHEDASFTTPMQRLSLITTELQEGIMKTRMQPIGNAWAKFPRLVRDLALELGKKIELRMIGAETELDRQLLDLIKDPLTHMVRNSADHGVETIADRIASGKNETGTITLSAYHEGGHIIIEINDDGRGINIEKIKDKIIKNNLASEAEVASQADQQLLQYIFRAGFSTAEKVTSVSGRGVGMDVVKTNIEKIGGTIDLKSQWGKGSNFQIKIPLTLAIVSVLIVESCGMRFAIPQISVTEMVRVSEHSEHRIEHINDTAVLRLRERLLPLLSLPKLLRIGDAQADNSGNKFIVVCNVGAFHFGLIVDRVYDTEEIVVKPIAPILQHIEVYSGSTILGDGNVIMILDPNGLARSTGEIVVSGDVNRDSGKQVRRGGNTRLGFLIFRAGDDSPKAVPLDAVSRLEEIDASKVEHSGGTPVLQYRGELMRLITIDGSAIPESGMQQVIVFSEENKVLGLIVDEITDITEADMAVQLSPGNSERLGSMVITGKTTEILDIGHLFARVFSGQSTSVMHGGKERIRVLLADYSPFYRNITLPFLAARGFDVQTAKDGEEALRILEDDHGFQAIVCDPALPGVNGFELAKRCQSNALLAAIPIIAFSSQTDNGLIEKSQEAGMRGFVPKTDRETLVRTIFETVTQRTEVAA